MSLLTPDALQQLLLGDQELALLDVREARQANRAHLNLARHAPLSTLELQIGAFVPRRAVPVVLCDEDDAADGPAARAAALLARLGYTDVRRLDGGLRAWAARGLPLIDGNNTLVKAFGDRVRQHYGTPVLPLAELEARRRDGVPTTLIDARPRNEYAFLSIAGARNHPGTELSLRRFDDQADPHHLWAINCFSRTRGIIGTTTLRHLGLTDRAVFVEDGVMAWGLRGAPVVQNARPEDAGDELPAESPEVLRGLADALVARHGLRRIDAEGLQRLRADTDRTLYLFDVRPPLPGAAPAGDLRHVAGGQVFMHFENLVGTRGARIVLVDDPHGLRAAITAFWLTQLNQAEVHVLDGPLPDAPAEDARPAEDIGADAVDADALARWRETGSTDVVDVGPSLDYERQHLPDAFFLLPSSPDKVDALLAVPGRTVVFTSPDGAAARLAARDALQRRPRARVAWLHGGTQAWQAGGGAVESGVRHDRLLTPFDDDWGSVMRVFGPARDAAWADYLAWERGLSARVAQDPTVRFRFFD
ncbi:MULTISPECIES: rhodanese-like domain-containing protein [unclassified Variovorax]|uniref:rhodanese-like domain-containing protein n=1 Tax=unclassified Variovorax TaxID=663243 RepID=UPI002575B087|nr:MULTISPECIES: rhodanese-like domain-containing protein [unclassified Variovorax]MDM0087580.1 rhodanese-like domain-containing protein [Variovorax sp. J22G40]MDM0144163.1 rhodanese-like domain-containing protein [Variovorax sp. J2P1-31]